MHVIFLDHRYLELAKEQDMDDSNLIQIMREIGAKFLGTIKDSFKYLFDSVEVTEEGKTTVNKRAVMQLYGISKLWTTTSCYPVRACDLVQASAFRYSQGKNQSTCIATSMFKAMKPNIFVYTTDTIKIARLSHEPTPSPLPKDEHLQHKFSTRRHTFFLYIL